MFTLTKIVFDSKAGENVETTETFEREDEARARFRELKRGQEYDYLHLWNGRTLARWTYGEEDQAHEAFMTAALTAEAERPWGMDAYKMPVIKDTMP